MNRFISLFFSFFPFFLFPEIHTNNPAFQVRDSLYINEVVVTGNFPAVGKAKLPMSLTVIDSEQIENRFEQSLLPILAEEVPGLFITSRGIMGYGVSTGAAGGMTMRGIGSAPTTQVLLLIDGHPQYMGLMGHPLADSYQSLMAEKVEVVRGPASVLYGSNAMGGVINIITKKQSQNGVVSNLRTSYGSYNTFSGEINNAIRSNKFHSYLSLDYNKSDGHRENMDFEQYSGYAKVGYDFNSQWKMFADLNLTNYKASNPGTEDVPVFDNDADILRGVTSFSLENTFDKTGGAVKFFYNFGSHKINDGYKTGEEPKDLRFRSNDYMLGVNVYQTFRLFEGNQVTGGFDYRHIGGHAWNRFMDDRPNADIIRKDVDEIAGYLSAQQELSEKFVLNAGLRIDKNTDIGTEWVPQAGLSYIPSNNAYVKGMISKGFRNPTIREMYMFPPQNPDLKAERLMNYEISGFWKLPEKPISLDVSIFYINGDNAIQTIPVNGKPLNINTGKIENYGVEFSGKYAISSFLNISTNYSYLHMRYKTLASPEHKLYAGIYYTKNKWMATTGLQYIHGLYTDIEKDKKESFALWNARVSYRPLPLLEVFLRGENLLAQKYEINAGYPMPKATVFGGINVSF